MDLKFTFNGGSQASDHSHDSHGAASPGIPLPFSTTPAATSSVLEIVVRRGHDVLVAEALSGDGVNYSGAEVACAGVSASSAPVDVEAAARAVRSALSRSVAGLEGPLSEAVTAVVLDLGGVEPAVLAEFGIATVEPPVLDPDSASAKGAPQRAAISGDLQRRTGIAEGTPIRF